MRLKIVYSIDERIDGLPTIENSVNPLESQNYQLMSNILMQGLSRFLPSCESYKPEILPVSHELRYSTGQLHLEYIGNPSPTFEVIDGPEGLTINPESGILYWDLESEGNFPVEIKASNSEGSDTVQFSISTVTE